MTNEVTHINFNNGISFDVNDPINRLRIAASSSFFGEPTYYKESSKVEKVAAVKVNQNDHLIDRNHIKKTLKDLLPNTDWAGKSSTDRMILAIDAALDFSIELTLHLAVELRESSNIRTTPQIIMVRAANHPNIAGKNLLSVFGNKIMSRLDEVMVQAEYHFATYGKKVPSRLKRAWARRLEMASEYELSKYKREGHDFNIYDVVNLVHPASDGINKLMKGELKLGGQNKTWESIRAAKGSWEEAAKVMGHQALLKNLRNLDTAGIVSEYCDKLLEGVAKGKQLPFRYYSAYQALPKESVARRAVANCLDMSCDNLPFFPGNSISLTDNSGSAHEALTSEFGSVKVSTIGNLMGLMTARRADNGYVGVFGDKLETIKVAKDKLLLEQLDSIEAVGQKIGHRTEHGIWLFFKQAIEKKEHWDNISVYSDMQAGHGGLYGLEQEYKDFIFPGSRRHIDVGQLISKYRKEVNPKVMIYLVQTAGYQDTLVPEYYDRTFIMGGWSQQVLLFAHEMNRLFKN